MNVNVSNARNFPEISCAKTADYVTPGQANPADLNVHAFFEIERETYSYTVKYKNTLDTATNYREVRFCHVLITSGVSWVALAVSRQYHAVSAVDSMDSHANYKERGE